MLCMRPPEDVWEDVADSWEITQWEGFLSGGGGMVPFFWPSFFWLDKIEEDENEGGDRREISGENALPKQLQVLTNS